MSHKKMTRYVFSLQRLGWGKQANLLMTVGLFLALPLTVIVGLQVQNYMQQAASSQTPALEAEEGTSAGDVTTGNDSSASGGKYAHFGAPTTGSSGKFYYGVLTLAGFVTGSPTLESYIKDWQSRGFDTSMITNNTVDYGVSDRLGYNIIASPYYDLYRQWFFYENYHSGQTLESFCGGTVDYQCAKRVIPPLLVSRVNGNPVSGDYTKNHPSVVGYTTIDDAPPAQKERIRLANVVINEEDPKNPSSPILMRLAEGQIVHDHVRPNSFAYYFYPAAHEAPACNFYSRSIGSARDWVDQTRETMQEKPADVPFWAILQTHGDDSAMTGLRTPTAAEIRLMNWLAIGEDAKGIFWFTWDTVPNEWWIGLKDNTALLTEVTDLARRVKGLYPVLSKTTQISSKFQVSASGNRYSSTLKDFSTGKIYVVVANHECAEQDMTMSSWYYNAQLKDVETGTVYTLGTPIRFRAGDGKLFEVINPQAITPPTNQANLILNPGFESVGSTGFADKWSVPTASGASRDTSVKHSGTASLKVTGTSATVTVQNVTLKPNTKYYASWYQKGQSLTESRLGFSYQQKTPTVLTIDSVIWNQNGSYDWVKRIGSFKTPSDYASGQVIIGWDVKSGGTFWIDDLVLCEVDLPCQDAYLKERE